MESSSPKVAFNKSKVVRSENNVSLYVGATALFVSVATVLFFYREISKLKNETRDIKQIRNQVSNIDKRFDLIDRSMDELIKLIKPIADAESGTGKSETEINDNSANSTNPTKSDKSDKSDNPVKMDEPEVPPVAEKNSTYKSHKVVEAESESDDESDDDSEEELERE